MYALIRATGHELDGNTILTPYASLEDAQAALIEGVRTEAAIEGIEFHEDDANDDCGVDLTHRGALLGIGYVGICGGPTWDIYEF